MWRPLSRVQQPRLLLNPTTSTPMTSSNCSSSSSSKGCITSGPALGLLRLASTVAGIPGTDSHRPRSPIMASTTSHVHAQPGRRSLSGSAVAPPSESWPRNQPLPEGVDAASPPYILGCNVYVSEGRHKSVIQSLEEVCASTPGVALLNVFVDEPYNRTGFTLTALGAEQLSHGAVALTRAALSTLDFTTHQASHPRLGSVDHISVHPLAPLPRPLNVAAGTSLVTQAPAAAAAAAAPAPSLAPALASSIQQAASSAAASPPASPTANEQHRLQRLAAPASLAAAAAAQAADDATGQAHQVHQAHQAHPATGLAAAARCAQLMAAQLAGGPLALPVYLYGAAHPQGRRLAEIRRSLGYFKGSSSSAPSPPPPPSSTSASWQGALLPSQVAQLPPDLGPANPHPSRGLITLGAVPWIVNYNVPLQAGVECLRTAQQISRKLSERGGGLAAVEAMALTHGNILEVACNILDYHLSPPELVQQRVEQLCAEVGIMVMPGYRTGKPAEQLVRETLDKLT